MKSDGFTTTRRGARLGSGLYDELIVDNFAGAGGASMGIEAAAGRSVDIAINHDRHSVEMHQVNHPHTRHLCEDVWNVDPMEATAGRPVGLAWFSPDCRHFSRAKGGKPVEKKIRGLAWVVVRWAKLVKPRVIILENVREFQEWGPLTADSRPCAKRKGLTFKRWVGSLRNLGYVVEWRILNAADYGAPTHRRRLFLVARCDGQPIVFPEPTHGPGRRPYRTAAECIDWSLPCPSIFLTKTEARHLRVIRPLADKTMRRIAMGLKRYVLDNPKPFIVTCNHSGPEFRGQAIDEPMRTLCAARDAHGVVAPYLAEVQNASSQIGHRAVDRPAHTITANPNGGGMALAAPHLIKFRGECNGADITAPMPTITSGAGSKRPAGAAHAMGVISPFLAQRYGEAPHQQTRGQKIDEPIRTITPANNSGTVIAPSLVQYNGEKGPGEARGHGVGQPINTIPTENRFGLCAAFLAKHYGGVVGHGPERPLGTVTSIDHHSVVASHLTKFYGTNVGSDQRDPMPTVTADGNHIGEVRAFLIKYFGQGCGSTLDEPLHTVTSRDRFGLVKVDGSDYQIIDIGLRMLSPVELLRAQFGKYAAGYVLTGTKSQQVAKIGNSVPPQLAEAMVRANFTEMAEVAA